MRHIQWSARAIADDLESQIRNGKYRAEDKLPSQQDLANDYGVHRDTAARAYDFLKDRGIAYGEPGVGVFVRREEHLERALGRWRPPPPDQK